MVVTCFSQLELVAYEQLVYDLCQVVAVARKNGTKLVTLLFPRNATEGDYSVVLYRNGGEMATSVQPFKLPKGFGIGPFIQLLALRVGQAFSVEEMTIINYHNIPQNGFVIGAGRFLCPACEDGTKMEVGAGGGAHIYKAPTSKNPMVRRTHH